jgi:hypothetical protein
MIPLINTAYFLAKKSALVVSLVLWLPKSFSLPTVEAREKRVPACWCLDLDD